MATPRFSRRGALGALTASALGAGFPARAAEPGGPQFPALAGTGDRFRVALIADPQVEAADSRSVVAATSQERMSQIVREINALDPAPAFVLFNGDLVNSAVPRQIENFLARAKELKSPVVLVHGNHDGWLPYPEFRQMQQAVNGTEHVRLSFNCGRWHFTSIPCNFRYPEHGADMLAWLEADLRAHQDRPVMAFIHYHLMPQGLSQLEWYTYEKGFKKELLDVLARHGNVRYCIGGHVHNGIQVSVKTAWTYRGTRFLVAPTCTASRNFGEEYPAFAAGLPRDARSPGGGYWMLLEFDGPEVRLHGRLAGVEQAHAYPAEFPEYRGDEPLWLRNVTDDAPAAALGNGSFEQGLAAWRRPWRYRCDHDPGFLTEVRDAEGARGGRAVYLYCRDKGQPWAEDELNEVYQRIALPPDRPATVRARFRVDEPSRNGGGYLRLCALRGGDLAFLALLHWGDGDRTRNHRMGANSLYTATGRAGTAFSLIELGRKRRAAFWPLQPREGWNEVSLDLAAAVDAALERPGAFRELGADSLLVSAGVWCHKTPDSRASCLFDDLEAGSPAGCHLNGAPLPLGPATCDTDFGLEPLRRSEMRRMRQQQ